MCVIVYIIVSVGGAVDADRFRRLSGGKPSRKCGIMSSGNHLFFSDDGLRMLVSNDMDLANARYSYSPSNKRQRKTTYQLYIYKYPTNMFVVV